MSRIEIITVDDETYVVDHYNDYHIIYENTDDELSQPLGYFDPETQEVNLIDADEEDENYIELIALHEEIRKIDADAVAELIKSLQMADQLPTSQIEEIDDPYNDEIVPPEKSDTVGKAEVEIQYGEPLNQLEVLDMEDIENLDTSLLGLDQLAETILTEGQEYKFGNIEIDKTITGQVIAKQVKQEYEKIYPPDILFSELVSTLQDEQVPADIASSLAAEYLNIAEINGDRILSSKDPFEVYKYSNPILYRYLKNLKSEDLPRYHKYWLIPIVFDVKKVYDSQKAENQEGAELSTNIGNQLNLIDEIKKENEILSRLRIKTDHQVNNEYVQSQHAYQSSSVGDRDLFENITGFENPDFDQQDYTIHVLRYNTINSNRLELRKAYGAVYKVKNKYENMKKLTKPIIGLEHYLSVDGETVNTVGFLRLPIKIKQEASGYNLQTLLKDYYAGIKELKIYTKVEDIPKLTIENANEPIAIIFPKDSDLQQLEKMFLAAVPSLEAIVEVYKSKLNLINNLEQVNQLLKYYDITFKELSEVTYNKLVQILRQRTEIQVTQFLTSEATLTKLVENKNKPVFIKDFLITNPLITNNYGVYPDFNKPKDSDLNRLIWITKQLDSGRLFYSVMNHFEIHRYYLELIDSKVPIALENLPIDQFTNYLTDIDKKINNLNIQIKTIEDQLATTKTQLTPLMHQAAQLTKQLEKSYKPLIYVGPSAPTTNLSLNEANTDLSNVFIWNNNEYVPQAIYSDLQAIKNRKLQLGSLELEKHRTQTISQLANKLTETITQNITRLRLLQSLYIKNNARAQIATKIKAEDLVSPDQSLLDLFKHIKNANIVKADEMYLKLINSQGILSADGNWIISKLTQQKICCVHKKDQLLGLPLDKYEDPKTNNKFCIICHEQIGEIDFDTFGGYDADDNPIITHEGSVMDTHLQDLALEMVGQPTENSAVNALDCAQFTTNPFKKYACYVLKFIRDNHQIKITDEQLIDSINLFYTITKMTDLKTNINVDPLNKFIQQKTFNQFLDYYTATKSKLNAKQIRQLASIALVISRDFDLYILTLISAIIKLELSHPEIYLSAPTKLIDIISEQQLSDQYVNTKGQTIKLNTRTMFSNMGKITIDNIPLLNNTELNKAVKGDLKLPFIGTLENVRITEYAQRKFIEYYNDLIEQPDIKIQYLGAKELVTKLDLIKKEEKTIVDPETLLDIADPVESFNFDNFEEYNQLINQINQRLRYLNQLRMIRTQKLSNAIFNMINNNPQIIKKLASYPVNPECPTDIRQFYVDYLMSYDTEITPEDLEDSDQIILPHYIKTPAIKIKPYTMSGQKQEFEELVELTDDAALFPLKTQIAEIDQEISTLNQKLIQLQKIDKMPEQVQLKSKPSSTVYEYVDTNQLYDKAKSTHWKTMKEETIGITNPLYDPELTKLRANSKNFLQSNIDYLVEMLSLHLKNQKQIAYEPVRWKNILENLGNTANKLNEINLNITNLKNKYNHEWNIEIIKYLFQTDYFHQIEILKRDLIKNYIYLTRYIVSVLQNQFGVENVEDVNTNIINLIEYFRKEVTDFNIFKHYKYIITNEQLNSLVGVFDKNEKSLDTEKYLSPTEVNKLLHYSFVTELVQNFKALYKISDSAYPMKNSQEGLLYAQFVAKLLDLIDDLNQINDTTSTDVNNMKMASISKKSASYQSQKAKLSKDELSIWNQQMKYKFKSADQLTDPTGMDIFTDMTGETKPTKSEKLDQLLNVALDIPNTEIQGEYEFENPDEFGDDVGYD